MMMMTTITVTQRDDVPNERHHPEEEEVVVAEEVVVMMIITMIMTMMTTMIILRLMRRRKKKMMMIHNMIINLRRKKNTTMDFDSSAFGAGGTAFDSNFSNFPSSDFGSFPSSGGGGFAATTRVGKQQQKDDDDYNNDNMDYEAPSFGGGWRKRRRGLAPLPPIPKVYDKTPIDNPPVNLFESTSTKIKFIPPRAKLMMKSIATPSPVANPLTGHLILCNRSSMTISANTANAVSLLEWNPHTESQVLSTPILTLELQRKVAQKYGVNACEVDQVLKVTAGIHQASGYDRCRVAALLDLKVLENKEVLRVIAVWQWGYGGSDQKGGHPIALQSVLSPPSGSDFTYDPQSLLVNDSCVFVAGASAKGPCVFLCKPTVRETWSANFVGKDNVRISHMAAMACSKGPVDPDSGAGKENDYTTRLPYLAVAMTDGTVSIWTYEAATKLTAKTTSSVKRLLFPLCRLESTKVLKSCPATPWSSKDDVNAVGSSSDVGYCTHLEWISPRASSYSQLNLLAASFQGGLCLYHVALPKIQNKDSSGASSKRSPYVDINPPTEKTKLSETAIIKPFCYSKWSAVFQKASGCFIDLGPHVPPSMAILVSGLGTDLSYARIAMVTCPLPVFGSKSGKKSADRLSFHVWDSNEWTNKRLSHLPRGLITSSFFSTRGVLYYSDNAVEEIEYRTNSRFPYMSNGVGSIPVGLTTSGTVYWADSSTSSGTGVLSVYTTYHCERSKSTDSSSSTMLEWTMPSRRHWLIQTFIDDCKESTAPSTVRQCRF